MTDGCKFHAGDMGAQTSIFAPKFPQNGGIQLRICAFPTAQNLGDGQCCTGWWNGKNGRSYGCRYGDFI